MATATAQKKATTTTTNNQATAEQLAEQVQGQQESKTQKQKTQTPAPEMPQEVQELPTKSAKIRALSAQSWTRSQIAKALDIRYQHVRNVLVNPPKKKAE